MNSIGIYLNRSGVRIILALVISFFCLQAQAQSSGEGLHLKKSIAVASFDSKVTNFQGGEGMAEMLTNALVESDRFVVLERVAVWNVLDEQDFAASGRAASASNSAETGKVIPSQLLVIGTITEYSAGTKESGGGFSISGLTLDSGKAESHIGLIIRIIDSTTGEVIDSASVEGSAKSGRTGGAASISGVSLGGSGSESDTTAQATEEVIRNAVAEIVARTRDIPFQGKLIRVDGGTIYANVGARNGAKPGDTFSVYAPGVELIDPDTGESLGTDLSKVGSISLVDIQEKFSRAVAQTGAGFEQGHIILPAAGGGSGWTELD